MRCSRSLYFSMLFSVCMSGTFTGVAFLSPCLLSLDAEWYRSLSCLPLEEWESEDLESKEWLLFSSPVLTLLEDLFPSDLSYKVNKDYVWFIVWNWFFGFIFLLTFPCYRSRRTLHPWWENTPRYTAQQIHFQIIDENLIMFFRHEEVYQHNMNTSTWNNEPNRCPSYNEVNEMLYEIKNFTKLILTGSKY